MFFNVIRYVLYKLKRNALLMFNRYFL